MSQTFAEPVTVRFQRQRHRVLYVSEAGALLYAWPRRTRRLVHCQDALRAVAEALDNPSAANVEAARLAFVAAAKRVGVLEPG